MLKEKFRYFKVLACGLFFSIATTANADTYPQKPIRIVVGAAPGGATDLVSRMVAQKMAENLGQPVYVENKPGGDTLLGVLDVKGRPADGYTILAQSLGYSTLPYTKNNPRYTHDDFTGVGMMSRVPFIFLVGGEEPVGNVAEYVARAKKQPLSYGHPGVASAPHIAGELFQRAYGLNVQAIPYKGNGAVIPDVIAGRVSFYFDAYVGTAGHISSKKMKALAVTTSERLSALPNVPTFRELGVDLTYDVWLGLLVRKETPAAIVARLSEALKFALESKDVGEKLKAEGSEVKFFTPTEFNAILNREYLEMGKLATELDFQKN